MHRLYKKTIIFQILADYFTVAVSFLCSYILWKVARPEVASNFGFYLRSSFVFAFVYVFIFLLGKLYEQDLSIVHVEYLRRIIKAWIIGAGLLFAMGFLSKELCFSRLTFLFVQAVLLVSLLFQKLFLFNFWHSLNQKDEKGKRVLMIGVSEASLNVFETLKRSPWMGMFPVGFVSDHEKTVNGKDNKIHTTLGGKDDLQNIIREYSIKQAVIDYSCFSQEDAQNIIKLCAENNVLVHVIPHFYSISVQRIRVHNVMGIPLLSINEPKNFKLYLFLKRIFDICLSLFVLVGFSPIIVVIAVLVKRSSSGPIFFSQERVGENGRLFKIYKFRSMYVDAPKYSVCPDTLHDPRVTKIGRFIRRTSLDELPQLFNVLKGDMSIVGPRPEMQFIVEKYNDVQKKRLNVRPGVTGLWQISHKRGSPIHENIDYDLYYIENRCFTLDLAIILQTILSVARGIGAC